MYLRNGGDPFSPQKKQLGAKDFVIIMVASAEFFR
jgi:hypothetical protein